MAKKAVSASTRGIPIQERACAMGNIIGVNAYHVRLDALKRRLIEGGYDSHETPHFLVCCRPEPSTAPGASMLLVHWFAPDAIDSNLGHYLMEELKPLGLLANAQQYGEVIGAVVNSVAPRNPEQAWHLFATNTLRGLRDLIASEQPAPDWSFPMAVFAALYRRVYDLCAGESLLDAGCSSGFLPLMMAELLPSLTHVVGIDIYADPFAVARMIAREKHLVNVQFIQADLLSDDMALLPAFDTVTLLHVLEHFSDSAIYGVLANLLKLTARRLIIAVPFEEGEPEPAYGHEQLFTREKLEAVGNWCIEQWGNGTMRYEDCAGGLLWVERMGRDQTHRVFPALPG